MICSYQINSSLYTALLLIEIPEVFSVLTKNLGRIRKIVTKSVSHGLKIALGILRVQSINFIMIIHHLLESHMVILSPDPPGLDRPPHQIIILQLAGHLSNFKS